MQSFSLYGKVRKVHLDLGFDKLRFSFFGGNLNLIMSINKIWGVDARIDRMEGYFHN